MLLLAAAGYAQSLLSSADVAALFLSRKILLGPLAQPAAGACGGEGRVGDSAGSDAARFEWILVAWCGMDRQHTSFGKDLTVVHALQAGMSQRLSTTLSAALFVAAVEAAWQAQQRMLRPLPSIAQRAAAPLQIGLRVARAAVWIAALVLTAAQTRSACQAAGDSAVAAAQAATLAAAARLPAWLFGCASWQPGSWRRWQALWGKGLKAPAAPVEAGSEDAGSAGCSDAASGDGLERRSHC
jgi:hypothetical protein